MESKPKYKSVTFTCPVTLLDKVDRYCEAMGYTRSELIRRGLRKMIGEE